MAKLTKLGNLAMEANSNCTIVTICNWNVYQSGDEETRQPTRQPDDSHPTGTRQLSDTNKKVKKSKKVEKDSARPAEGLFPDPLLELIEAWNALGPSVISHTARLDPPSKAVAGGWRRAQGSPAHRNAFADLPAITRAIQNADFCHGKPWFRLEWLFATNKAGEFNIVKLLEGGYANRIGNHRGAVDIRPGHPARPRNEPVKYRNWNTEVADCEAQPPADAERRPPA
jgi:hypothetical protein